MACKTFIISAFAPCPITEESVWGACEPVAAFLASLRHDAMALHGSIRHLEEQLKDCCYIELHDITDPVYLSFFSLPFLFSFFLIPNVFISSLFSHWRVFWLEMASILSGCKLFQISNEWLPQLLPLLYSGNVFFAHFFIAFKPIPFT